MEKQPGIMKSRTADSSYLLPAGTLSFRSLLSLTEQPCSEKSTSSRADERLSGTFLVCAAK